MGDPWWTGLKPRRRCRPRPVQVGQASRWRRRIFPQARCRGCRTLPPGARPARRTSRSRAAPSARLGPTLALGSPPPAPRSLIARHPAAFGPGQDRHRLRRARGARRDHLATQLRKAIAAPAVPGTRARKPGHGVDVWVTCPYPGATAATMSSHPSSVFPGAHHHPPAAHAAIPRPPPAPPEPAPPGAPRHWSAALPHPVFCGCAAGPGVAPDRVRPGLMPATAGPGRRREADPAGSLGAGPGVVDPGAFEVGRRVIVAPPSTVRTAAGRSPPAAASTPPAARNHV